MIDQFEFLIADETARLLLRVQVCRNRRRRRLALYSPGPLQPPPRRLRPLLHCTYQTPGPDRLLRSKPHEGANFRLYPRPPLH